MTAPRPSRVQVRPIVKDGEWSEGWSPETAAAAAAAGLQLEVVGVIEGEDPVVLDPFLLPLAAPEDYEYVDTRAIGT